VHEGVCSNGSQYMPPSVELQQETPWDSQFPFQHGELRAEDKVHLPKQITKHKATWMSD
jgi:hypothetical protein